MATILDQYLEKQNSIRSQIAENSLPPEDLLIMQELNYRICVLETFQSFVSPRQSQWIQRSWAITFKW